MRGVDRRPSRPGYGQRRQHGASGQGRYRFKAMPHGFFQHD
jgi:hypothetical protein